MDRNVKNYTEQGGEVTHIGGSLVVEQGASIEGLPIAVLPMKETGETDITYKELFDLIHHQGQMVFFHRNVTASDALLSNFFFVKRVAYFPMHTDNQYTVDMCAFGNGDDMGTAGSPDDLVSFGINSV